jgi:hypothetical protein
VADIQTSDKGVLVRFALQRDGDADLFKRVCGWVHWQEMRVVCVPGEGKWQVATVELLAPPQHRLTVMEIVTGHLHPETAHHKRSIVGERRGAHRNPCP